MRRALSEVFEQRLHAATVFEFVVRSNRPHGIELVDTLLNKPLWIGEKVDGYVPLNLCRILWPGEQAGPISRRQRFELSPRAWPCAIVRSDVLINQFDGEQRGIIHMLRVNCSSVAPV
jgi:hypothetical protein